MPKNRLPAIADRAEWEKVTKSRAGTRWDSAVEKGWKDIGGNPEEMLSIKKFGAQDRSKRKDRNEGKVSACLLYTSPSPRDKRQSRMPSSA